MNTVQWDDSVYLDIFKEAEKEVKRLNISPAINSCQCLIDNYYGFESNFYSFRICMSYSVCAVKSYGQERRFFNPPPQFQIAKMSMLGGVPVCQSNQTQTLPLTDSYVSLQIKGGNADTEEASKGISNITKNIESVSQNNDPNNVMTNYHHQRILSECEENSCKSKRKQKRRDSNSQQPSETFYEFDNSGAASAATSYINEFDFGRFISLKANIFLKGYMNQIGPIESNPIKVISKPAKKKIKSTRLNDCNILSGSLVVLSNRFRSQSFSTKYLRTDNNCVECHPSKYTGIYIHKVQCVNGEFINEPGPITYGSLIRLTSHDDNLRLPLMYIRKIYNNTINLESKEQCLSLNRVAFECYDKPFRFLSLSTNTLRFHNLNVSNISELKSQDFFSSLSVWLLINIERVAFNFVIPAIGNHLFPHKIPLIVSVTSYETLGEKRGFEIVGRDFYPELQMFVGKYQIMTNYRCSNMIIGAADCAKDMDNHVRQIYCIHNIEAGFSLPILLVCPIQNLIFDTQYVAVYSYNPVSNNYFMSVQQSINDISPMNNPKLIYVNS